MTICPASTGAEFKQRFSGLVLIALFAFWVTGATAGETDPPARSDGVRCQASSATESSPEHTEQCDANTDGITDEALQQAAAELAEGTQDALTLKSLLLGRNYVFFGRAELDAAAYFGDISSDENGGDLRRLRIGMAGLATFVDSLSYKLEVDLTDGTNNWSDLYVQWDIPGRGALRIGNQMVSQNLSAMTSSLSHLFMEEPLPVTAFSLSRRWAVGYDNDWRRFGVHGMFFTKDANNDAGDYGWALRVFTKPIRGPDKIGHVGFSLVSEKMDREARYRTKPESNVTDVRLVDTGLYQDVQYQHVLGMELAGAVGSNVLKAEAFGARWERERGRTNTFRGAYVELGHFLTGQQFNYKKGKFLRPLMEPGERAWEVGLRASWLDLNDGAVRGGEQVNLGAALNYYLRPNLRLQANLLYFWTDDIAGDRQGWIAQAKIQFNR